MSQTATSSNAVGVAKGSSTAMAGGSNGGAKDLLIALHELVEMESDTNLDISIYKRKTRQLVQKLLSKMEQTVSRQRQLESELRIKNEQIVHMQRDLEFSRDQFSRELRRHRRVEESQRRDLQKAESFLNDIGSRISHLNCNFRCYEDEDEEENDRYDEESVAVCDTASILSEEDDIAQFDKENCLNNFLGSIDNDDIPTQKRPSLLPTSKVTQRRGTRGGGRRSSLFRRQSTSFAFNRTTLAHISVPKTQNFI